jgi:uncharacterized delta-60 repeat protein
MLLAIARFLPDGRLDPSFSRDGRLSFDFGYGDDLGSSVAVQPNGRIVVGGVASYRYRTEADFMVLRLRRNGTLDRTFSRDGKQSVNFAGRRYDDLYGLSVQPDGRIVAAGMSAVGYRRDDPRVAVLRLSSSGRLDRRFGKRLLRPSPHGGYAQAILVDRERGILVGGLAYDDTRLDTASWALVRFLPSGALDRGFGRRGIVLSDFGTGADWIGALAEQRDGKIVAAGEVYGDQAIARYLLR